MSIRWKLLILLLAIGLLPLGLVLFVAAFPVLWWNDTHDWISFAYQIGHGMPERHWSMERALFSVVGQFLSYGPFLVIPGG